MLDGNPSSSEDASSHQSDAGDAAHHDDASPCCSADAGDAATYTDADSALPDLRVNRDVAALSLWLTEQAFGENSCELQEMCVSGSGTRRLLRFEARIENWGPGDLRAGRAGPENPNFEYSSCHDHYHFLDFTDYRLLRLDGSVAAYGHKQSFCLISMERVSDAATPSEPGTHPVPQEPDCNTLVAGWADIYGVDTPCQWVDVTGVPEGDYVLQVAVNPIERLAETTTSNNIARIPIHLDAPAAQGCQPQPELCGDAIDQDCDGNPDQWDIDCYANCDLGDQSCTQIVPVSGNDRCELAQELTAQGIYQSTIEPGNLGDVSTSCGGAGGDVFFRFTLPTRRVVYLGALRSDIDTVLALYRDDCTGAALRCSDSACDGLNGHFAEILEPGRYVVAVKAKDAGASGHVRLRFQTANPSSARLIEAPGSYAGNTGGKGDGVEACDERNGLAREDLYVLAACPHALTASTCDSADFAGVIGVRAQSLESPSQACSASAPNAGCPSGERGAAVNAEVPDGLAFIVVEGEDANQAGSYQLSVAF
jgi:Lysyl oxidase